MTGALAPRLVLVTRETEYDGLLARHATRGQAAAFMRRRAQAAGAPDARDLEQLEAQRAHVAALLAEIRAGLPKGWRVAAVRRAELDRFLFAPEDVVVAVGQDGLVANLAKYLSGQPVIGVNAEPARNPGILVPHTAAAAAAMLPRAAAGTLRTEPRTMIQAELDDGQTLLALNEIFIGHASHQSARYSLQYGGQQEAQSSSGLIVASGTGATGWALSISRATGIALDLAPGEPAAVFLVREPWPSRATGASLSHGRLEGEAALLVVSRMNEGGVVFADGIEGDRLDFAWGRTLRVSVARRQLRFVPGETAPAAPAPAPAPTPGPTLAPGPRHHGRRPGAAGAAAPAPATPTLVAPATVAPAPVAPAPAVPAPAAPVTTAPAQMAPQVAKAGRRHGWRWVVLAVLAVWLVRGCGAGTPAPNPTGPEPAAPAPVAPTPAPPTPGAPAPTTPPPAVKAPALRKLPL